MESVDSIERRCLWLHRSLDRQIDEVSLLRAARLLKRMRNDLDRTARSISRLPGWTYESSLATTYLASAERDLRRVLLENELLDEPEMCRLVRHALQGMSRTAAVLSQADTSGSV